MTEKATALLPPDPAFTMRPVRAADATLLAARCWPGRVLWSTERLIARAQRAALTQTGLGVVALDSQNLPVGYGQVILWNRCAEISDLIVAEDYRCAGIGTAMIQYLVRTAREMQAGCAEIGAALNNPRALALYERIGFVKIHQTEIDIDGTLTAVQYLRLMF